MRAAFTEELVPRKSVTENIHAIAIRTEEMHCERKARDDDIRNAEFPFAEVDAHDKYEAQPM